MSSESIEDQLEDVHIVVQARHGALEETEVYTDVETAIKRYSAISSDESHVKTLLKANAEIEDLDL